MNFKAYNQWRQIIQLPEIPICDVFNSKNPLIAALFENLRYFYPNMPLTCPIKPGKYHQYNITIGDINGWKQEGNPLQQTVLGFPNGLYLLKYFFIGPKDPNALIIINYLEVKRRMNHGTF